MTETEIVVQDIRRELRWSFRDQSVANLLGLAKRLIDNKDTASIADAVRRGSTRQCFPPRGRAQTLPPLTA